MSHHSTASDAEFLETAATTTTSSVLDLQRSNLLRLQAQELVNECSLSLLDAAQAPAPPVWASTAHEYMTYICQLIESMPPPTLTTRSLEQGTATATPFSKFADKTQTIELGDKSLQTTMKTMTNSIGLTKPSGSAQVLPTLDVWVKIPSTAFQPKDYLRHRYIDKRNTIVWHVAQYLSQPKFQSNVGTVYWRYLCGDKRKPVLLLVPPTMQQQQQDKDSTKKSKKRHKQKQQQGNSSLLPRTKKLRFRVQLLFGMETAASSWIPPLRLVPNRCNLATQEETSSCSVFYNHLLLEDMAHALPDHNNILTDNSNDDSTEHHFWRIWNDTTVLAKIWALQRGLLRGHDTFDTQHLAWLVLYLLRTKQANPRMAATQVLAALFKLLAETDWLGEKQQQVQQQQSTTIRKAPSEAYQNVELQAGPRAVLVMPEQGKTEQQTIASSYLAQLYATQTRESPLTDHDAPTLLELYSRDYRLGPVFLDSTMKFNYLGRLSPSFMRTVQREAQQSLKCMIEAHANKSLSHLFLTEARFWTRHDAYLCVALSDVRFGASSPLLWGHDRHDVGDYESLARGMVDVLRRALGDRVHAIRLLTTGNGNVVQGASTAVQDSDEIPTFCVRQKSQPSKTAMTSPTGSDKLVIGITLNSDTCHRIVDRGPPADDAKATAAFVQLWGTEKAQLRRFKDGAIVHAVVWESTLDADENVVSDCSSPYIRFLNDDRLQGGVVERIMRQIIRRHFLKDDSHKSSLQFSLRNIMSAVDGVVPRTPSTSDSLLSNPLTAHRKVNEAFDALSDFLQKNSIPTESVPGTSERRARLGIPLSIDAVEPLSPALRYAELFPPVPHPSIGSSLTPGTKKIAGAIMSDPIEIQVRFGPSSKWPADVKAMGAAKAAMLIGIVDGIEAMKRTGSFDAKQFDGPMCVTPTHADVGFRGYMFRVRVRADPELKLLQGLSKPSPEASSLLKTLTKRHVVSAMHHSMIHAVYTSHPSSSAVVRLARRWVSSHLLSGYLPFEAIELLVAHVYTDKMSFVDPPGTVVAGFLRFFHLLGTHDWVREPLVVDPQGYLSDDDLGQISKQFEQIRGAEFLNGPPMYIVSPVELAGNCSKSSSDSELSRKWTPSFTESTPESVVLGRAAALASRTQSFLTKALVEFDTDAWPEAFQESTSSFRSYSALLRTDPDFIVDTGSSSTGSDLDVGLDKNDELTSGFTRSMQQLVKGPKGLQRKVYRNLMEQGESDVLMEWNPIDSMVSALRARLGSQALFFYNDLCPEVIALLWRPTLFAPSAFTALRSEYVRPVTQAGWKTDTLMTLNVKDLLREVLNYTRDVVIDTKVFDNGPSIESNRKRKISAVAETNSENSDDDDDDDDDSSSAESSDSDK